MLMSVAMERNVFYFAVHCIMYVGRSFKNSILTLESLLIIIPLQEGTCLVTLPYFVMLL